MFEILWNYSLVDSLFPTIKTLPIPEKVTEKKEIELSRSGPIHMKFKVCLNYFVHDLGKNQLIALPAELSKTFHPLI